MIQEYRSSVRVDASREHLRAILPDKITKRSIIVFIDNAISHTLDSPNRDTIAMLEKTKRAMPSRFGYVRHEYAVSEDCYIRVDSFDGEFSEYFSMGETKDGRTTIEVRTFSKDENLHKKRVDILRQALKVRGVQILNGECHVIIKELC